MVLSPPRTVSPRQGGRFRPWLEVTLVVRVSLPQWGVEELVFSHWAAPWGEKTSGLAWKPFDPGRLAASAGHPGDVVGDDLDTTRAESLVREVLGLLPQEMYRQPLLGLVSTLGESFSAFRHRCLKAVARTVREGLLRRDPAAAAVVSQVVDGIEHRRLAPEEREVLEARVTMAYYPEGVEPGLASDDLMVEGGKGWRA